MTRKVFGFTSTELTTADLKRLKKSLFGFERIKVNILDIALPSYHVPRWFVDAPQLFPSSIHRSRSKQRTLLGRWWRLGWSWWVDKAGRCTWGMSRPGGSAAPVVGTFGKVVAP